MRRALIGFACASALASACESQDNTKVVVAVWSDLSVPAEIDAIRIDATGPGGKNSKKLPMSGPAALPAILDLVPLAAKDASFTVTAVGMKGTTELVWQSAHASFVSGQSLLLKLFLGRVCWEQACGEGMTCSAGACGAIPTPPLAPYDPNQPLLAPDASAGSDTGPASDGPASDGTAPDLLSPDTVRIDSGQPEVSLPSGGSDGSTGGGGGAAGGSGTGGSTGSGGAPTLDLRPADTGSLDAPDAAVVVASGGSDGSGGGGLADTGGTNATGGAGGATGGASGSSATGGTSRGGATGAGGVIGTGGVSTTGGVAGAGGATGGAAGTGGVSGTGGVTGVTDAAIVDTRPPAVDASVTEAGPIDTAPAIDTEPVTGCTETTKFSGGTVNADRTLSNACSPYTIKSDIDVNGNATLTIEAGVAVKFNPNTSISIGYNTPAKLVALGTAADPIVFTSSSTTPGAGDWAGLQLWDNVMNGTTLAYVKFDYCGSNGDACVVGSAVKPDRVALDRVSFAHVGPGSDAIWQKDRDSNFAISNCTFSDIPSTPTQQFAISVYAPSFAGIDASNTFNGQAMVALLGGVIGANTTWKNIGTTVAVTDDLSIEGPSTPVHLTVAAGSAFKFASGVQVSVGYNNLGSLVLSGTATSKITLGSLVGTPAPGDWVGIVLWSGGSAKIAYTTISYAGSDRGAITVDSNTSSLDIQDSTIDHSASYGIGIRCNSTATVTNMGNTFTSNASGDVGPGPIGPDC
jgi:hypothetical protein